jgi:renalase
MPSDSPAPLQPPKSCLIVGGGISGLIAGTMLQRHGINVTLLDKGRGIGGRLATRRIAHPGGGEGVFDYGTQVFTVSDPTVQPWVDDWLQKGIISAVANPLSESPTPGYRGVKSNRSIAQYLANDLDIHTQTRATQFTWQSPHWEIQTASGACFQSNSLIVTAPVPQSLDLLDASQIALPPDLRQRLETVTYQPCIAVLALLEQPSQVPAPGGLSLEDAALAWIACHEKQGISPQGHAVTLLATPEFSKTHWETDDATTAQLLFDRASTYLGSAVITYQVHRWRYSQPQTGFGEPYLALHQPGPLVLAGDAFGSIRAGVTSLNLERAVRSGLEAAHCLSKFDQEAR